jgi:hypothetical protein
MDQADPSEDPIDAAASEAAKNSSADDSAEDNSPDVSDASPYSNDAVNNLDDSTDNSENPNNSFITQYYSADNLSVNGDGGKLVSVLNLFLSSLKSAIKQLF